MSATDQLINHTMKSQPINFVGEATNIATADDGLFCLVAARDFRAGDVVMSTSDRTYNFMDTAHAMVYVLQSHRFATEFREMKTDDGEKMWNRVILNLACPEIMFTALFDDDWTLCPLTQKLIGPQWIYARTETPVRLASERRLEANAVAYVSRTGDLGMWVGGGARIVWLASRDIAAGEEVVLLL